MRNLRIVLLVGTMALFGGVLLWRWVTEWGFVTLNYSNAPLSNVIGSIENQGRVKISTNADPTTPVTIRLKRATVFEALDTLAVRIDGDMRLAYIGAPSGEQIAEVLAAFASGSVPGDWVVFFFGLGRGMVLGDGSVFDPRLIEWRITRTADNTLQALLNQGAQKTGALFAVPNEWNPVLSELPSPGKIGKVAADLARTVKGEMREIFLLIVRPPRPEGDRYTGNGPPRETGETAPAGTVFSARRAGRDGENPEWVAERAKAHIVMLPKEQQVKAQKYFDEMQAFWQSVRDLPEQERREKIEEQMSRPEFQEMMEERAAARDANSTPQQREQRYRNYIKRKEHIKGAPTKS